MITVESDATSGRPRGGTYQRDEATGKVGRVIGPVTGAKLTLRPVDGSPDFEAARDALTPVGTGEGLRMAIRQVNEGING